MPRIDQLAKMLDSEPNDVFLNFAMAMEYLKAERFDDALSQFTRVTEIDPDYCVGYFQHANTFVRMGQKDKARAKLEKGIAAAKRTSNNHAASEMTEALNLLQ